MGAIRIELSAARAFGEGLADKVQDGRLVSVATTEARKAFLEA